MSETIDILENAARDNALIKAFARASENRKDAKLDHDYSMREDGAESIGRISTASRLEEFKGADNTKDKKDKLSDLLMRLQQARLWVLGQIEIIQDDLDKLMKERDEASRRLEALEEFYVEFKETGRFNLGENGKPIDLLVLKVVENWEQENGRPFDFEDANSMRILQATIKAHKDEIETLDHQIGKKRFELDNRIDQFNQLEGINSNNPEIKSYAVIQLSLVEEEMNSVTPQTLDLSEFNGQLDIPLKL